MEIRKLIALLETMERACGEHADVKIRQYSSGHTSEVASVSMTLPGAAHPPGAEVGTVLELRGYSPA
jgi:hypothetical protein